MRRKLMRERYETLDRGARATEIVPGLTISRFEYFGYGRDVDLLVNVGGQPDSERVQQAAGVYVHAGFDDSDVIPVPVKLVRELGELVARHVREGENVVVHCAAGLNRSGLVVAYALTLLGWDAQEAIQKLRDEHDGYALCNGLFAEWLVFGDAEPREVLTLEEVAA
jgi:hypothetical protein